MTLDYIDDICLYSDKFPLPNTHALTSLRMGLHALAQGVRAAEIVETSELERDSHRSGLRGALKNAGIDVDTVDFNTITSWNLSPRRHLITNHFNWFSVSLIDYLRLVKLVDLAHRKDWTTVRKLKDNSKFVATQGHRYARRVAPHVYAWRDKIGAHRAITAPHKDTLAMLISVRQKTVTASFYGSCA